MSSMEKKPNVFLKEGVQFSKPHPLAIPTGVPVEQQNLTQTKRSVAYPQTQEQGLSMYDYRVELKY